MVASFCTPAGARTLDTLIKSQVLYQLSYKRIVVLHANRKGALRCHFKPLSVRLQGLEPWTP